MTFQFLIAVAALLWLASLVVCGIAFFAKRFITASILSLTALAIGYLGLTHFHFAASQTVNGQLQWSINSRWFFIATLILGALALAYTIWKHLRTNQVISPA